MSKPILNLDELEFMPWGHGDAYEARIGPISPRIGATKLGYNLTILPPGKAAFPAHAHRVNEEMFFVLEGQGEVRIGDTTHPLRSGDVLACPPGGPETAHRIANTGAEEMKILAVSTSMVPEIVHYPDSDKVGVMGAKPKPGSDERPLRWILREGDEPVDYWEGE